ncbi:hypothetical protein Y697_07105 [Mesotoga sp. BH458_6_3_2_1]|nr:hypothetical protein Y697_07105 [Mesotoga sp. BH458_6_3_2_1]
MEQVSIFVNITECEAASQEASQVNRQRFSVLRQELQARRKAPKIIGDQLRSDAAPQEVRPGRPSGEVMPTSSGSDAGAFAPGGKQQNKMTA